MRRTPVVANVCVIDGIRGKFARCSITSNFRQNCFASAFTILIKLNFFRRDQVDTTVTSLSTALSINYRLAHVEERRRAAFTSTCRPTPTVLSKDMPSFSSRVTLIHTASVRVRARAVRWTTTRRTDALP